MPDLTGDSAREEQLKAALWYSVGQIVDGCVLDMDVNADPRFIGGLSEMLWAQMSTIATDLEAFAHHAGRSTINTSDVVLLGRGNEGLKAALQNAAKTAQDKDTTK